MKSEGPRKRLQKTDSLGRNLTEKGIQNRILKWLDKTGYLFYRQNAGTLKRGKYKVTLGPKGIPDVIVILPPNGRFLGLEVKVPGRYQNPSQKAFQAQLEAAGGIYKVVRSLKEAQEAVWKSLGLSSQSKTSEKTQPSALDPWS